MIVNTLFLAFFVAVAAFVSWRLWISIATKRVDVRGWVFERSDQPGRYWTHISLNVVAALLLIAIAAVLALGAWNA